MFAKSKAAPQMEDSLASIKKAIGVGLVGFIIVVLLLLASIGTNLRLASQIAEIADRRPIYVIPGAAEGVYAPGLTKYNVKNAARFVLELGVNLTSANAKDRLAQLEKYCSPEFLPKFRLEKARLLKEIQDQSQSRAVHPDPNDELSVDKKNIYTYIMQGPWEISSGSLVMSKIRHQFTIRFSVGNVDEGNPYGIKLHGFDAAPIVNAASGRSEITDTSSL